MGWKELFGLPPKRPPVWSALCTGRADGSNPKYIVQAKHPILAMVRVPEAEVEHAVFSLLQSNGWSAPSIQKLKLLSEPFYSDDPIMRAGYEGAIKREGGIVVYSDPIEAT
jgi:hypothetical protein